MIVLANFMQKNKLKIGVVGLGYWGPSYVRNFVRLENAEVTWVCDTDKASIAKIKNIYPFLKVATDYHELLKDKTLDVIAIATPPETHFKIVSDAITAKKHVLVSKPLAGNFKDSLKLLILAKKHKVNLACDLTYIYTGAVKKISSQIKDGSIGVPLYYDSIRTNFGRFQSETNVITDLIPHDLSILMECFETKPTGVLAVGSKHYKNSRGEEMAHVILNYPKGFAAHLHVSWLTPVKIRTIQIGGSKKMLFFDDVAPSEKVKIYDNGVTLPKDDITPFKPFYRIGDVVIPKLDNEEALFTEIKEFVTETSTGKFSYKTAKMGCEISKVLDACQKSLKSGRIIRL